MSESCFIQVSDQYAFLPREVITFYLLNCEFCKPRIQKYGPSISKAKTATSYLGKAEKVKKTVSSKRENLPGKEQCQQSQPKSELPQVPKLPASNKPVSEKEESKTDITFCPKIIHKFHSRPAFGVREISIESDLREYGRMDSIQLYGEEFVAHSNARIDKDFQKSLSLENPNEVLKASTATLVQHDVKLPYYSSQIRGSFELSDLKKKLKAPSPHYLGSKLHEEYHFNTILKRIPATILKQSDRRYHPYFQTYYLSGNSPERVNLHEAAPVCLERNSPLCERERVSRSFEINNNSLPDKVAMESELECRKAKDIRDCNSFYPSSRMNCEHNDHFDDEDVEVDVTTLPPITSNENGYPVGIDKTVSEEFLLHSTKRFDQMQRKGKKTHTDLKAPRNGFEPLEENVETGLLPGGLQRKYDDINNIKKYAHLEEFSAPNCSAASFKLRVSPQGRRSKIITPGSVKSAFLGDKYRYMYPTEEYHVANRNCLSPEHGYPKKVCCCSTEQISRYRPPADCRNEYLCV